MNLYKITIHPESDFLSALKGDMLFGMFCCTLAEYCSEQKLEQCLEGYAQNNPFAVFSDAFPSGYFPRPCLPAPFLGYRQNSDDATLKRKDFKRKQWIASASITLPSNQLFDRLERVDYLTASLKTSNKVNPKTEHASGGMYSAYTTEAICYMCDLDLYILLDENRITLPEIENILKIIGAAGYGRRATAGKGKFSLKSGLQAMKIENSTANSLMTLAPSCPQFNEFDVQNSFYHVFVRFGRHGGHNIYRQNPFKKPVITMDTGAILRPKDSLPDKMLTGYTGTGIKYVSLTDEKTLFQGYAPVIPLTVKGEINEY